MVTKKRIDEVALGLCGSSRVWYGNPQLCHDIYDQSGHTKAKHPLNVIAAVVGALAKSDKWHREGFITHLGRRYPVYAPNKVEKHSTQKSAKRLK